MNKSRPAKAPLTIKLGSSSHLDSITDFLLWNTSIPKFALEMTRRTGGSQCGDDEGRREGRIEEGEEKYAPGEEEFHMAGEGRETGTERRRLDELVIFCYTEQSNRLREGLWD